jgi:hypothetical protein
MLEETDCQRKFMGRDEQYFGMLLAAELEEIEKRDQINREKPIDDRLKALEDGMAWIMRKDPVRLWAKDEIRKMKV